MPQAREIFTEWDSPYPHPVVVQEKLGANSTSSSYFTSYFLNKSSIAVMSMPSFSITSKDDTASLEKAVVTFLQRCKEAGMKKLVIDVRFNGGGDVLTGFELFQLVGSRQIAPKTW
jgi:C-terminal processing protease CtpA/Prc